MVDRNPHVEKLHADYLFGEIARRKSLLEQRCPEAWVISLGVGDTTAPIAPVVAQAIGEAAAAMSTPEGYRGYNEGFGLPELQRRIASRLYGGRVSPDEVYVGDGACPALGRMQLLLGSGCSIAVPDPAYPNYLFAGVVVGQTGAFHESSGHYQGVTYLKCTPENGFFPDLASTPRTDLIFFCSPNNPTGTASSREQLQQLVDFARANESILLFDAAYRDFVRDDAIPKSIYELDGARRVAIELGSFSKLAGFTGARLGWTIVPHELTYRGGKPLYPDWEQMQISFFDGASNIIQHGGIAVLGDQGLDACRATIDGYLSRAALIRETLTTLGYEVYGGAHAPYLWARVPGLSSWEAFDRILEQTHVVTTPGVGFGPAGEGFLRFSAFAADRDVAEAMKRLASR
ncbi:MAG: LL-diaminopimelate aminotransferase [Vicinamibacterales bacterium]|jgi:LL-diaminopimelate aminotransferase|nr:LL-diaminopimelate aminotransferase [Acidobacteriota bacterium]MDP6371536.1 LL-diaminopimelate aminotransferase [Vicinamibacterales bacterium]MQG59591.1 LL-diaminopimelate aminotransferase [SAR202 cluster bacterium]MDP6609996.1 LL-diaminopimelate aminotransferase [Vicinamibacterales bacterium]MQG67974.1 LL-diaminopimelate aminotransferase [SAR202 cluster bacterium]|tara:strand:+ start:25657 stop:26865 length:1209 start_codon:yes stop_codon:yes gene_type:complete